LTPRSHPSLRSDASGIGRTLALQYAAAGHLVGATGRRQEMLDSLQQEYPDRIITECYQDRLRSWPVARSRTLRIWHSNCNQINKESRPV
jgi:NAD(P)-dependent dehydrogenase (short-subunit alcohol dehydrogenase family)